MKPQIFIQFISVLTLGLLSATSAYALDPINSNNNKDKIAELQKALSKLENKISAQALPTLPTDQSEHYVLSFYADTNSLKWTPAFSKVNNTSTAIPQCCTNAVNRGRNRFSRRRK